LMHSDIEISDAFVNHVLGPILELPHQESSRLLETLEAFIGCDGSISDVSSTTFMHRNTVRKRLDRVEALSGRSLAAPAQAAELVLALAWLRRSVHTEPEPDAED
jgi:DNA-binding PucR family transcriptional regulator